MHLCRLREIMDKIRNDDISKHVLLSNLDYVARVLENSYIKETRSTQTDYNSPLMLKASSHVRRNNCNTGLFLWLFSYLSNPS